MLETQYLFLPLILLPVIYGEEKPRSYILNATVQQFEGDGKPTSKKFGLQGPVSQSRPQNIPNLQSSILNLRNMNYDTFACPPHQIPKDFGDGKKECVCAHGFTGTGCATLVCSGHGTYREESQECDCYPGYGGMYCSSCVDEYVRARDTYHRNGNKCVMPPHQRRVEGYYGRGMGMLGFATVFLMIAAYSTWRRRLMTRNARTLLLETVIQRESQSQQSTRRNARSSRRCSGFVGRTRQSIPLDFHFTGVFVPSGGGDTVSSTHHHQSTQYEPPPAYYDDVTTSGGGVLPKYSDLVPERSSATPASTCEPPPSYNEAVLEIARRQRDSRRERSTTDDGDSRRSSCQSSEPDPTGSDHENDNNRRDSSRGPPESQSNSPGTSSEQPSSPLAQQQAHVQNV